MTPRLKSRLWVEALLRRCAGEGQFGAVVKVGADEAGAVFVALNRLDGGYELLEPPPGASHDGEGQRLFEKSFPAPVAWGEVQARFERRLKADPDLWLVEIEVRTGHASLKVV